MNAPLFSIITPTFNRQSVISRSVRSVQAQTSCDYEHIVVDDGSQDDTAGVLKEIGDGRLRYEQFSSNQGANVVRNYGIQIARGEWITFLDSDDEYLPCRLAHLVDVIERYPGSRAFVSSFRMVKRGGSCDCVNAETYLEGSELERALMAYGVKIAGTAISVRRDLLQQVGGFSPSLRRLQDRQLLLAISRFSGAHFLSRIDWCKHNSLDSISEQPRGYVAAVDDLLNVHPELAVKYRRLVGYHVARGLAKKCLRLDFTTAFREWRANKNGRHLNFGLGELCRDYLYGKQIRQSDVFTGA